MKSARGFLVLLLFANVAFAQAPSRVSTQAPAEPGADARDCGSERRRVAALIELNVSYREKIDLLEQKIKELEKRK